MNLVWNGGDTGLESRPACIESKPLGKKKSVWILVSSFQGLKSKKHDKSVLLLKVSSVQGVLFFYSSRDNYDVIMMSYESKKDWRGCCKGRAYIKPETEF